MPIDAHHHYWDPARGDYGWLTPELKILYRPFGPADLEPLRETAGIERTVVVQAAPTIDETRYLARQFIEPVLRSYKQGEPT